LASVRPLGGQRGTEVVVDLTGARLGDAREVMVYQPGVRATKVEVVHDTHVRATLAVAADARLGIYDLRLRTATGLSELRTFNVGALPERSEVEPNGDFLRPQVLPLNSVVNGLADIEDADYYAVEAKKGDRITAEVEGIRLGVTMFDPYVAILDGRRFELASSDDAALTFQDGVASVVAPADGTYVVLVRESAYAGNAACVYRLHVGTFPRPTATVPAGGRAGETLSVRWVGDVLGEVTTRETLPPAPLRAYGVTASDARGVAPHANAFRVSPFGNVMEVEPNDARAQATPFAFPAALNGVIGRPGDVDHFAFRAAKGQALDLKVYARQLRSPLDSVAEVGEIKGGALVGNDDATGGPDSALRFIAPADGEYAFWIYDQLRKGGDDYFYRVEVTPVTPRLSLSVPGESPLRGGVTSAAVVPRGNRQAVLVNATRWEFGGDLRLDVHGLPPGVRFEADTMAAGVATIPVLFTAEADASPAGSFATVAGRPTDEKVVAPCEFSQTNDLVVGQNNLAVWARGVEALAVAVAEEAPFAVELVEPKVPLVRGGSMGLKAVVRRKPGFTAAVDVALPWNPPGLGSGGVTVPENQDEAVLPVNADGAAELRTWKVLANATAATPGGPVTVSSPFARLTVAAPFVALAFQSVGVDQGKECDLAVKVTKLADFPGAARVTLLGLPNKVTAEPRSITKDSTDLTFHIKTDPVSPAGNHANLFCQVVVESQGEPIVHNIGTGQLRVDVPLPPKVNAPTPSAPPAPPPPPAAGAEAPPTPPKPPSRLEKLRQGNQDRAPKP